MKELVKRRGYDIQYLFEDDITKEIAMETIESDICYFYYLPKKILQDKEIQIFIAKQSRYMIHPDFNFLREFSKIYRKQDCDFIVDLFKINLLLFLVEDYDSEMIDQLTEKFPPLLYDFLMSYHFQHKYKYHEKLELSNKIFPDTCFINEDTCKIDISKVDDELMIKLLKLNGRFLSIIEESKRTVEMKDIAYRNGMEFKEKQINRKWILDTLRFFPGYIFDYDLQQFLIEDEDLLDDCLEINPRYVGYFVDEQEIDPASFKSYPKRLLSSFKSLNFCETKYDECSSLDDFLVTGLRWNAPLEIRQDLRILSTILSRRNFKFQLLEKFYFGDLKFSFSLE